MAAVHISDKDFDGKVVKSKLPVLVDFYAEWCGPCKLAAPVLDKLAEEFKGKLEIYKLDVDASPETPRSFGVMSIPTIIAYKDGKEVGKKVGFGGEQGYRKLITELLGE